MSAVRFRALQPVPGEWEWHSNLIELRWLPVIGPSTFLLYRRAHFLLGDSDGPIEIPLRELAVQLGLSPYCDTKNTSMQRSLRRLVDFGFALADGAGQFTVRRSVRPPSLSLTRRVEMLLLDEAGAA